LGRKTPSTTRPTWWRDVESGGGRTPAAAQTRANARSEGRAGRRRGRSGYSDARGGTPLYVGLLGKSHRPCELSLAAAPRRRAAQPSSRPRGGGLCGPLCRVVELDGQGPRHTIADVDSHVHHPCKFVVRNLGQKVKKATGVKPFLLMF